jgi:AraC family ethanolamine operon transcriptional activator
MTSFSHTKAVGQALAFVQEQCGEPVSIAQLCEAAGVCARTLRHAFHAVHGVSPKQYLIRCALDGAHNALQQADGVRGAVTQVATEYGFFELGRFAGAYRHRFGELPSDTLRACVNNR